MTPILITLLWFVLIVAAILLILYIVDWALTKAAPVPRPVNVAVVAIVAIICVIIVVAFLQARGVIALG